MTDLSDITLQQMARIRHESDKIAIKNIIKNAHPGIEYNETIQLRTTKDGEPYYHITARMQNYETRIIDTSFGTRYMKYVTLDGSRFHYLAIDNYLITEIQRQYAALGTGIELRITTKNSVERNWTDLQRIY